MHFLTEMSGYDGTWESGYCCINADLNEMRGDLEGVFH